MAQKNNPNRNLIMDAMRGVAAMWVVVFHFNEVIPFAPNFWQEFCKLGWLGVPIFFVISGWCMAMITQRERSPAAYLAKRLLRIFPPYWASLLAVLAVIALRHFGTGVNDVVAVPHHLGSVLATLTLLIVPVTSVPAMNWVYWSLTYEVMFYFLVAAGLWIRRVNLLLLLVLPLCLFRTPYAHNQTFGGLLFFADQYPLFALGFFCRDWKAWRNQWPTLLPIGLAVALAFLVSGPLRSSVAVLAALLLARSEWGPYATPGWLRSLAMIGDWSYSLYLIHVPASYLLLRFRSQSCLNHLALHIAYDLVALGICIAFAALIYRIVEEPSHRLGQFAAAKIRARSAAPNAA